VTDLPIIVFAQFILDRLTSLGPILGVISLFGLMFVKDALVYFNWI